MNVSSPQQIRQSNALHVLEMLRRRGPMGRTEIAKRTGLSKPTVNTIVGELLERDYVSERGPAETMPQRPGPQANLIAFQAGIGHVVGFELSRRHLRAGLSDLAGHILGIREESFPERPPALDDFAEISLRLTHALLADFGLAARDVWAAGMGLPGFVDRATGEIRLAPGFEAWHGRSFREVMDESFHREFGCSFVAGGRVQFSILAEHRYGAATELEDAIFVHLRNGIGLGILAGGEVVQGAAGFAGEIGSIAFGESEPSPPDVGPFEWMAGGWAFARFGRRAVQSGESPILTELCGGNPAELDAPMVLRAAERGDEASLRIVGELMDRLAQGLAAACCMFNPAKLIVGPGLFREGDPFIADLERRIAAIVPFPIAVECTKLCDQTCILGAVEQAVRLVEKEDFFLFAPRQSMVV